MLEQPRPGHWARASRSTNTPKPLLSLLTRRDPLSLTQCLTSRIDDLDVLNDELAAWQTTVKRRPAQGQLSLLHHHPERPDPKLRHLYPTVARNPALLGGVVLRVGRRLVRSC